MYLYQNKKMNIFKMPQVDLSHEVTSYYHYQVLYSHPLLGDYQDRSLIYFKFSNFSSFITLQQSHNARRPRNQDSSVIRRQQKKKKLIKLQLQEMGLLVKFSNKHTLYSYSSNQGSRRNDFQMIEVSENLSTTLGYSYQKQAIYFSSVKENDRTNLNNTSIINYICCIRFGGKVKRSFCICIKLLIEKIEGKDKHQKNRFLSLCVNPKVKDRLGYTKQVNASLNEIDCLFIPYLGLYLNKAIRQIQGTLRGLKISALIILLLPYLLKDLQYYNNKMKQISFDCPNCKYQNTKKLQKKCEHHFLLQAQQQMECPLLRDIRNSQSICDYMGIFLWYAGPVLTISNIVSDILYLCKMREVLLNNNFYGLYLMAFVFIPGLILIGSLISTIKESDKSSLWGNILVFIGLFNLLIFKVYRCTFHRASRFKQIVQAIEKFIAPFQLFRDGIALYVQFIVHSLLNQWTLLMILTTTIKILIVLYGFKEMGSQLGKITLMPIRNIGA